MMPTRALALALAAAVWATAGTAQTIGCSDVVPPVQLCDLSADWSPITVEDASETARALEGTDGVVALIQVGAGGLADGASLDMASDAALPEGQKLLATRAARLDGRQGRTRTIAIEGTSPVIMIETVALTDMHRVQITTFSRATALTPPHQMQHDEILQATKIKPAPGTEN